MNYYVDSSENPSSNPEDSLAGPYSGLSDAQEAARAYASGNPGCIYYVNAVKTIVTQVYIAEAVTTMRTEIVDNPQ